MDVGGAVLHAEAGDIDKYIIVEKSIADILVKIKPDWEKFRTKDGKIYAKKNKALYGSTDAAELWYRNISATLTSLGFTANPYDKCIFNLVNNKKSENMITIALHVDDLLVTAKEQRLLEWLHRKLKEKYGEVTFN